MSKKVQVLRFKHAVMVKHFSCIDFSVKDTVNQEMLV